MRYFIVFYNFYASGGSNGSGMLSLKLETYPSGSFINEEGFQAIRKRWPGARNIVVVPANILELNETDYNNWLKD